MPELPEVETVARQLARCLTGRTVRRLTILDPRLRAGPTPCLAGRPIVGVSRSGKRVLVALGAGARGRQPLWLAVHLRMTGRLLFVASGAGPAEHLRARVRLDRGQLLFVDARRFGTFDWYPTLEAAAPPGIDPLDARLTVACLADLLRGSAQPLKAWLLRQDRLTGLGNIYASEILHAARLSPFRPAGSLARAEIRGLLGATRGILERAIRACGTTFADFQDANGVEGSFQRFLAVYDREGQPCRRCRAPIERAVQQQRSTYYCPRCSLSSSGRRTGSR
jgi:formamidopyrimidine-DNA glycosylase